MRAIVFIDGQNLFHTSRDEFGLEEKYPVYDPRKIGDGACDLITEVMRVQNAISGEDTIKLAETRFYTGIPKPSIDPTLHAIWRRKLAQAKKEGVTVVQRPLKYYPRSDGLGFDRREKGIDIRIALDILMLGLRRKYEVAVLFSRDGDFAEVATELKALRNDSRFSRLRFVCCFPRDSLRQERTFGVEGWIWCPFDRAFFEGCWENRDFRARVQEAA